MALDRSTFAIFGAIAFTVLILFVGLVGLLGSQNRGRNPNTDRSMLPESWYMVSAAEQTAGENVDAVTGWEPWRSRRVRDYLYTNYSPYCYVPDDVCVRRSTPLLVLIMVTSSITNFEARTAIRQTWASDAEKYNMKVLFMVGLSENEHLMSEVLSESFMYRDVIIEDFMDTYNNLTLKALYMLKWVDSHCRNAHFLLKIDDDVYANLRNLRKFTLVVEDDEEQNLLTGHLITKSRPYRTTASKWFMPTYMYQGSVYPNYCEGVGYLMSVSVALRLYYTSLDTDLIYLEDVFVTGMCAAWANITPKDAPQFHYYFYPEHIQWNFKPTYYLVLVCHNVVPNKMYEIHRNIIKYYGKRL